MDTRPRVHIRLQLGILLQVDNHLGTRPLLGTRHQLDTLLRVGIRSGIHLEQTLPRTPLVLHNYPERLRREHTRVGLRNLAQFARHNSLDHKPGLVHSCKRVRADHPWIW